MVIGQRAALTIQCYRASESRRDAPPSVRPGLHEWPWLGLKLWTCIGSGFLIETAACEPFGSRVEVQDGAVDCSGVGPRLEMFAVK